MTSEGRRIPKEDWTFEELREEAEDIRHEGKNYQAWYLISVPTEYTTPPIRDGVPHIPKPTSHEPPVRTGTSSPF